MQRTTTETFVSRSLDYLHIPTWGNGTLTIAEGGLSDHGKKLEIQGIAQKTWMEEIQNYVRTKGYETGEDAAEISAWLSNMADTIAQARGKIEKHLAENA